MFEDETIFHAIQIYNQTPDFHFWKDNNHKYSMMNDKTAHAFGYQSSKVSYQGITDYDLPSKANELAEEFITIDNLVLSRYQPISTLETFLDTNEHLKIVYVRKFPLFDNQNNIMGVAGYATEVLRCPILRSAISFILEDLCVSDTKRNISSQRCYQLTESYHDFHLTSRESETLFLMLRGKITKEIAHCLSISPRTVEKYQEQLKLKLNSSSKSHLIEKAISSGAAFMIPIGLLRDL